MGERDRLAATGLVALMLILWLGFLVHQAPRFAGSAWGGVLGVSGAVVMLIPLAYSAVKRISRLKRAVTPRVPLRKFLAWHIYAGIGGPILGLLHTGHRFESPLGIALTTAMILSVLSGFVGRYLMVQVGTDIREKKELLTRLELAYRETAGELAARPAEIALLRPVSGLWSRLAASLIAPRGADAVAAAPVRALRIAESMADLEYAIRNHEALKRAFARWVGVHVVTSLALYVLLGLHVWASVYFGLRWFS